MRRVLHLGVTQLSSPVCLFLLKFQVFDILSLPVVDFKTRLARLL